MSRVPMGSDGGAWYSDPAVAFATYFVPQGIGADLIATLDGYSREDVDAYAVESQRRAAAAWKEGRFAKSVMPVRDPIGDIVLERDEHMRPDTTLQTLSTLKPAFAAAGEQGGFDAVAQLRIRRWRTSITCTRLAIPAASSMARRPCWSAASASRASPGSSHARACAHSRPSAASRRSCSRGRPA